MMELTNGKDVLKVTVDGLIQQTCNTQFVHVYHGRVAVVEHQRMPQVVVRGAIEGLLSLKSAEKHLCDGPGVTEVIKEGLLHDWWKRH